MRWTKTSDTQHHPHLFLHMPCTTGALNKKDVKHNGNGFVGHDPDLDVVIVAFAGTDTRSMKNWSDDLDGVLAPYRWASEEEGCVNCKVGRWVGAFDGRLMSRVAWCC